MAANNNSVNFKVFLRDDSSTEARRFVVDDASVVTSFLFMREKLQMIFPKLQGTIFRITWKDSDGDEITVDSDEDLITAFTEMNGTVKILYVTILERKSAQQDSNCHGDAGQFHGRVVCDVCENPITGYRYKCMQCPDYDLCSTCEFDGHHAEHMMLRTARNQFPFGRCTRKVMEHINKSIRKGNHMAYKEACRSSKYKGKYDRMWGDNRRSQSDQEQPQTSQQQNEAPESSTQQEQRPSGCPMQDINLEHITPLIYPFLDALNNTTTQSDPETGGNNQGAPHFMNLIRNAINGFFEGAATHSQQAPESSDVPATAATSSETTPPNQQTPVRNVPMDIEKEIDASKAPQSEFVPRREPGWTIISNRENQSSFEASKPTAPSDRENSKIADGLKQLLDMGFSDELNLVALLRRFDGNVGEVVKYLFEHNI